MSIILSIAVILPKTVEAGGFSTSPTSKVHRELKSLDNVM